MTPSDALNEGTAVIEQKAAIKVTVPRNPQIRTMSYDCFLRGLTTSWQHRVRYPLRKSAIGCMMYFDSLIEAPCWQSRLWAINNRPCCTMTCIGDDAQRL